MNKLISLATLLCGAAGLASCGETAATPAATNGGKAAVVITAADRQAAENKFKILCSTCHGPQGTGDGPASIGLVPPPRNFQNAEWQASVTDEHIEKIIVGGGGAVGKAITMPSNPDLKSKPGVVAALREHIRSLVKK